MKTQYEQIILGAGASGLMLASLLRDKSQILMLEGNASVGAKISVSGGGRCNLTNEKMGHEYFLGDNFFVTHALSQWSQKDTLNWFEKHGLKTIKEKNSQYFCLNGSREVLQIFDKTTQGVDIKTSHVVLEVVKRNGLCEVKTNRGSFVGKNLIVATGGLSFSKLGATPVGYTVAEKFGHSIIPTTPGLVGMTLQPEQFFFKSLSGISTEVVIKIGKSSVRGDLLFAHKGISGPGVLDASLYWKKGQIEIDFLPDFNWKRARSSRKQISTILPLPKRLAKMFLEHLEITDKSFSEIDAVTFEKLKNLSSYSFAPAGTFGYSRAEVTSGGVSTEEIDPSSMESRLVPGLFFLGEVLDITGRLGGYNLQWAFSSAAVCANTVSTDKIQKNMV